MRKLAILWLALMAIAGTSSARTHRKSNKIRKPSSQISRRATPQRPKRATPRYAKRARIRRTTSSQPGPTPERYKEIQQALADKGYYKGEVNGQWAAESTNALSRFQADQNLKVDGKLGSLSLIALGLGPKRTANLQAKPGPPAPEAAPPETGVPE
jgi:peptidoglycan hydrolase-like protein with peptidoglycan-binding domain